ncbi:MAG: PLP-dependent transferase [Candidatus Gastranaerophilales bacterium]|nr:PLP-dependent transferase [Candidatus Gastranaerophilales bacterium]
MPGHKGRAFGELSAEIAGMDITEIDGFDNLHEPEDLFLRLQQEASRIYGAEESFYLVNGSTAGVLSAISAALPKNGHILMARGSHKSAYHAAYLRNLRISYLYPSIVEGFDLCDAIEPWQIRDALEKESDIDAVFLVSPTYEGRIAKIREIAEIVHDKGLPLIVDEAHGAHLGLAAGFAPNSCQAGADLVIHSVHKTLPAMTQTALLHVNGERIDRERLKRFLHIYQSSSPSYLLMGSIDNALRVVDRDRERLFENFHHRFCEMRRLLENCRHLEFLPLEASQDIGKLVISGGKSKVSGQQIYDILRREYGLQLEMASVSYCLAMFTIGDCEEGYDRMTEALLSLDARIGSGEIRREACILDGSRAVRAAVLMRDQGQPGLPFAKAWDRETEWKTLEEAVGCYVGEFVNLYPPGIPLLAPGEVFTREHCRQIAEYIRMGLKVQGIRQAAGCQPPYRINIIKGVED